MLGAFIYRVCLLGPVLCRLERQRMFRERACVLCSAGAHAWRPPRHAAECRLGAQLRLLCAAGECGLAALAMRYSAEAVRVQRASSRRQGRCQASMFCVVLISARSRGRSRWPITTILACSACLCSAISCGAQLLSCRRFSMSRLAAPSAWLPRPAAVAGEPAKGPCSADMAERLLHARSRSACWLIVT